MTPFRFGVNTWTAGSSREWIEKARRVETLGYTTLRCHTPQEIRDRQVPPGGPTASPHPGRNAWVGQVLDRLRQKGDWRHYLVDGLFAVR